MQTVARSLVAALVIAGCSSSSAVVATDTATTVSPTNEAPGATAPVEGDVLRADLEIELRADATILLDEVILRPGEVTGFTKMPAADGVTSCWMFLRPVPGLKEFIIYGVFGETPGWGRLDEGEGGGDAGCTSDEGLIVVPDQIDVGRYELSLPGQAGGKALIEVVG